jgi:hypothetical protein
MKTSLDSIKNPELRQYARERSSFIGLTEADSAAIPQNRLVEVSSGEIVLGTDDDANIIGATMEGAIAKDGVGNIAFGVVEVLASGSFSAMDKVAGAASGRVRKFLASQGEMLAATNGGNFGNQPAADTVQVLSSEAADTTQTVTLYYTKTGATTTVTTEVLELNGTTAVDTGIATVQNVLAVVVSAAHAGTITVREKSGSQTITTLTAGTNSAGFHAITSGEAYGAIPTIKAGGASTKIAGVVGVGVDGAAQTAVVTLNGATDVNLGSAPFDTLTYALLGDVASASTATIETKDTDTNDIGVALEDGDNLEVVKIWMQPYGI